MSSKRVSELPVTTSLENGDEFVVNHTGSTNKIAYNVLIDNLGGSLIKRPPGPDGGDYLQYDNVTNTWKADPVEVNQLKGVTRDGGVAVKLGGGVNFSSTGDIQVVSSQLKGITLDDGVAVKKGESIEFNSSGYVEVKCNNLKGVTRDGDGVAVKLGGGVSFSSTGDIQVTPSELKGITLDNGVAVKKGASIEFNSSGDVEVKCNNLKGITKDGDGVAVKLDGGGGLQFNVGGEIQPVVNVSKGMTLDSGLAVKLDATGGLMFNGSGEIKLAPAAASSNFLVVRPSAPGATDDVNIPRKNEGNGVLEPYFRSLIPANYWARVNITGNYTIFIDEDTIEGTWGLSVNANLHHEYITQDVVNNIFGVSSGMKEGVYVWTTNVGARMVGDTHFPSLGNDTRGTSFNYVGRFLRDGGWYSEARYFNEAPRAINFNLYFTNNTNLDWRSSDIDTKWGIAASRVRNWTERLNRQQTDTVYVRSAGGMCIFNSQGAIKNLNFVTRHNTNDITISDTQNSKIHHYNVSYSLLGQGYYAYNVVRNIDSEILFQGDDLYSSQDNTKKYPGYAMAIIGNTYTAGQNLSAATKSDYLFLGEKNAWTRFVNYAAFLPNDSKLNNAIIMDGDFAIQSAHLFRLTRNSILDIHPAVFVKNNLNIRRDLIDDTQAGRVNPGTVGQSVFPLSFNKGNSMSIGQGTIRKYTLDGSSDATGQRITGLPVFRGSNITNPWGGFVYVDPPDSYFYDFDTTTDDFRSSNIDQQRLYTPGLSGMLDYSEFFSLTENGATSALNYGAGVRA